MQENDKAKTASVHPIVLCFYWPIAWWVNNFGDPELTRFWQHKGYRAVIGGHWGEWDMGTGRMRVKMWWPSPCGHYPKPPLANHDEPLKREEYR